MSSIVNKVKDALHSDKDKTTHVEGTHTSTHPTTTTGSHNISSAADPRIHSTHDSTLGGATGTRDTALGGSDNYTYGTGANRGASGPASRTDGPHESNLLNKADPRVDSDRDHSKNMGMNPQGTATTGTGVGKDHPGHTVRGNETGFAGTTAGSGIGGAQHHSGLAGTSTLGDAGRTTGPATRTDGPHQSNLMNKTDPRVDSDRDHSRNMGMNPQGTATTGTTGAFGSTGTTGGLGSTGTTGGLGSTGTTGAMGTTGSAFGSSDANRGAGGLGTRTDGPHSSNLMNKADPRVDSDRDHSRNMGMNPQGTATTGTTGTHGFGGTTGTTGTTDNSAFFGTGTTGTSGINRGTGGPATRTDGPHGSNLMNQADPRVDSDRDHSRNMGMNPHGTATSGTTGTHGLGGTTGTTGTHNTRSTAAGTTGTTGVLGSSGTTGTTGTHNTRSTAAGSGPGPAPNTAGPHSSDLLNKADPRVDSDLDGSKTVGGNKTYAQS